MVKSAESPIRGTHLHAIPGMGENAHRKGARSGSRRQSGPGAATKLSRKVGRDYVKLVQAADQVTPLSMARRAAAVRELTPSLR